MSACGQGLQAKVDTEAEVSVISKSVVKSLGFTQLMRLRASLAPGVPLELLMKWSKIQKL